MRYAPEHNEEARSRILEAASRLFREHGVEGVGLAKIMAEAELTVGALVECLSQRRGVEVSRAEGAAFFGLLVGTLQLARATPDRAASAAILEAGIRAALVLSQ